MKLLPVLLFRDDIYLREKFQRTLVAYARLHHVYISPEEKGWSTGIGQAIVRHKWAGVNTVQPRLGRPA